MFFSFCEVRHVPSILGMKREFLRLASLWSTNNRWLGLQQFLRHVARFVALFTLALLPQVYSWLYAPRLQMTVICVDGQVCCNFIEWYYVMCRCYTLQLQYAVIFCALWLHREQHLLHDAVCDSITLQRYVTCLYPPSV